MIDKNLQNSTATEFILYACPIGTLADQIDACFVESRRRFGENIAHHYMPHCTLTGFFHDVPAAANRYVEVLNRFLPPINPIDRFPVMTITHMAFDKQFHRIELESLWLKAVVEQFMAEAETPTRIEPIRKKDWLHLSLAYEFPPEQDADLKALAERMIDLNAECHWVARFYERHPDRSWTCHQEWPLD